MTFLPIVERELRVASRRAGTYWVRTGVALTVISIGAFMYLTSRRQSPAEMGTTMFITLTIIAGLFCLSAGARATADCLSEEKRDGTLGLLFLTDLRGFDVVAGKLVAGSLNSFYGLIVTLPMLALPILMGGVTAGEFWRVSLVLLNTMFFSLSAGMIASALTKSARNSAGLCMLIVMLFAALLPMTGGILASYYNWSEFPQVFALPSPGAAFYYALAVNFPTTTAEFVTSLLITHACSWLFLIVACIVVPRSWQDKAATVTQVQAREKWLRWSLGNSVQRAEYRSRLLDVNAFYWLASRSRIKPAMVWGAIGVAACGWIWCWLKFGRDWLDPMTYIITAFLLNSVLKGWFASEACTQLAEDRRTGALELLLSTPLDVRDVMHGQFLALCRQFLWPLVFTLVLEVSFIVAGASEIRSGNDVGWWVLTWISGLLVLFTDLWALFYVGLWQSLTARNANRASSAAMVRIMALPWIIWGVMTAMILSLVFANASFRPEGWHMILFWLLISLGVNALFGFTAKANLRYQFRQVAMTRYTPPTPLWKRLFSRG